MLKINFFLKGIIMKVGIFFGSSTGNTESAVEKLVDVMNSNGFEAESHNVASVSTEDFDNYETMIFATSTWNDGELQDDFDSIFRDFEKYDFAGKKVGFVGLGDQDGYSENFVDGIGLLYNACNGAEFFGSWPTAGYDYDASVAEVDGKFIGLPLDSDNQDEMTEERIEKWVAQIKKELGA
jgi:flavodoxin I